MSTKEEAINAGALHAVVHSMKRRSSWHNYKAAATYMITLVTRGRQPLFGHLTGDPSLPLFTEGCAKVVRSELGNAIIVEEIPKISRYYPMIEVWKVCVMPDHLHFILRVKEDLPQGKHMGTVIDSFKYGCNKAYWQCFDVQDEQPTGLFENNFCDKILSKPGQLERWKHYLDDNPRRLMIKQAHPDLFKERLRVKVEGHDCVCIGNRFLLDIPDKMEVVVHRRDSDDEYKDKMKDWMQCGENYGVLVGAFISEREQAVKQAALENDYTIIQLTNDGIGPCYKPSGNDFYYCATGRMLILSPWPDAPARSRISRWECLQLNDLAEKIAKGRFQKA